MSDQRWAEPTGCLCPPRFGPGRATAETRPWLARSTTYLKSSHVQFALIVGAFLWLFLSGAETARASTPCSDPALIDESTCDCSESTVSGESTCDISSGGGETISPHADTTSVESSADA